MKTSLRLSLRKPTAKLLLLILLMEWPALTVQAWTTTTSSTVTLTVTSTVVRDHSANPMMLGFNVPWDCVQGGTSPDYSDGSNLWNSTARQIQTGLRSYLATDFVGALYRYPGGTTANFFEWEKTVGSTRQAILPNAGYEARVALFGVDEFLRFVESVKGVPMLQVNMYTIGGTPITTDAQWATLKQNAIGWLEYCNASPTQDWNGDGIYQGQLRANNGHPTSYNVTLWELGNELDLHGEYTKEEYATRSAEIIDAMLTVQPNLKILAHARTSPWEFPDWKDWHNAVLAATGERIVGIAYHPYYGSVSYMNWFTSQIETDISTWAVNAGDSTAPGVSITEHARWPSNIGDSTTWPECTSLSAAIRLVDFVSSHQYKPYVQMALNHALACNSPWAQFSQVDSVSHKYLCNTIFAPRPTAYALQLLHHFMPNADMLSSSLVTPKTTSNEYDVSGYGFKYGSSGIIGAVFANYSPTNSYPVILTFPGWSPGNAVMRLDGIGGPDGNDGSLWKRYVTTSISTQGQATLRLPFFCAVIAQMIAPDLMLNGDFEIGSVGTVPSSWQMRFDGGSAGTVQIVADTNTAVTGSNVVRIRKSSTSGQCSLVQPAWSNPALTSSGIISQNLYSSYVLRANVRTSSLSANSVNLKAQCFDSAGNYLATSPVSAYAPPDTAGKWIQLEVEFVPKAILQGTDFGRMEVILSNASSIGYVDIDSVTLQQRKNWAQYPVIQDSNANGAADGWENRIDAGAGTITYSNSVSPAYVRLVKSVNGNVQFVQTQSNNSALGTAGVLNARSHEKWRLKAWVRYDGLNTQGAQLKVQCFASDGTYLSSSPVSTTLTGSCAEWTEVWLEFNLREILGLSKFGRAEIMLMNKSTTGYIDVCFMSLETVD